MNKMTSLALIAALSGVLHSCASLEQNRTKQLKDSYLTGADKPREVSDSAQDTEQLIREKTEFSKLNSMSRSGVAFSNNQLSKAFSGPEAYQVASQNMGLEDFIHYVFGELLETNYLLTPDIKGVKSQVTLNINDKLSGDKLFELAERILVERGVSVSLRDNVYLISKVDPASKLAMKVGLGRELNSVPLASGRIMQIVPVLYGIKTSLKNTVEQLTAVQITIDVKQSTLFVTGEREKIIRALELIHLLDSPANRGRQVGMVELAFIDVGSYLEQMSLLLENEGIPNSINAPNNNNLVFVPLNQIGAVAVFAATDELLNRVKFWSGTLDKPSQGDAKRYYVFYPKYARAKDIGESLRPLIDASLSSVKRTVKAATNSTDKTNAGTGQLKTTSRSSGASNDRLTLVVDERSNAMIFYSSGTEYKNILPLIRKLDVLPKQVLLEVMIAEVRLIDAFSYGVEWALTRGTGGFGSLNAVENGPTVGDGLTSAAGVLNLFSVGSNGDVIKATMNSQDSNINILSRPTLLVRDGVTASIDIGAEIAVTSSTVTNLNSGANSNIRNQSYRSTGISVSVTPTVNAQGIVIMAIDQSLSNTVADTGSATSNPDIFERKITTEVVAESGQTIILAGLIDERDNITDKKVPLFGDIPILGNLFKSKTDNKDKTELVLMITPKVIDRTEQWEDIMSSFEQKLEGIKFDN